MKLSARRLASSPRLSGTVTATSKLKAVVGWRNSSRRTISWVQSRGRAHLLRSPRVEAQIPVQQHKLQMAFHLLHQAGLLRPPPSISQQPKWRTALRRRVQTAMSITISPFTHRATRLFPASLPMRLRLRTRPALQVLPHHSSRPTPHALLDPVRSYHRSSSEMSQQALLGAMLISGHGVRHSLCLELKGTNNGILCKTSANHL